jgi:hypothetical protein
MPGLVERAKYEQRNAQANGELTEGELPQKDTKEHKKKESVAWVLLWTFVANQSSQRPEANSNQSRRGLSELDAPLHPWPRAEFCIAVRPSS